MKSAKNLDAARPYTASKRPEYSYRPESGWSRGRGDQSTSSNQRKRAARVGVQTQTRWLSHVEAGKYLLSLYPGTSDHATKSLGLLLHDLSRLTRVRRDHHISKISKPLHDLWCSYHF